MFQSFHDINDVTCGTDRVARLRGELKRRKLDGFLVPRTDEYMNEYVAPYAERLLWQTGFSGSAGLAIILKNKAALFVDGRYILQVRDQVDLNIFEILQIPKTQPGKWLKDNLRKGARLGFDPKLHTIGMIERLRKTLAAIDVDLIPEDHNPIDTIWKDQPEPPLGSIVPHSQKYAGQSTAEKIKSLQKILKTEGQDAAILTLSDSIAWTFNIRGDDIPHTPLPLSFAILHAKKRADFFIDGRKVGANVRGQISKVANIHEPELLTMKLTALGNAKANVRLDPSTAAEWFALKLKDAGAEIVHAPDPCLQPKAIKNKVEIAGMRTAHQRDGEALCRFFAWLDEEAPTGKLDEITAAKTLETFRAETGALKEISFDTISGAGPNGAIIHYRVTEKTNRKLKPNTLYLVDSGAQYLDGTTDVTRTIALGNPTKEMCTRFTLVLKGHIAIACARFPEGTRGVDLDSLARMALWKCGLDYDHGTGHGVGSYLSVHEGPQGISKRNMAPLKPGMILSNEPGYYKEGRYGIRIENLVLVTEATPVKGGERNMMGFETLTLAPIDRRLIEPALLTDEELAWLNTYHTHVRKMIGPSLEAGEKAWLKAVTAPISF